MSEVPLYARSAALLSPSFSLPGGGSVLGFGVLICELVRFTGERLFSRLQTALFFFFFITLGLELSDTKVYEP